MPAIPQRDHFARLQAAHRPLILAGTGIPLAKAHGERLRIKLKAKRCLSYPVSCREGTAVANGRNSVMGVFGSPINPWCR